MTPTAAPAAHVAPSGHGELPPPVQMVQLLAGFQVSQALYVAARLDLATILLARPRPVAELAAAAGAAPGHVGRLLRTLAALGVFEDLGDGSYGVTPLGSTLARDVPGSVRGLALTWMETHYAAFSHLVDGVREGETAATLHYGRPFFDWLGSSPEQVERFTGAMADLTRGIKAQALAGYELPPGRLVADIGGADGTVLTTLLAADPDPDRRGVILDLPHVVPAAQSRLEQLGLAERVAPVAGDFFESVPAADVYLLSMVLHDWDDAAATRLLRTIAAAARPGARLVALELVVPPGNTPHMSKMIDLTMLGMLTGRERTAEEHVALLAATGFTCDRVLPTAGPFSIIEATLGRDAGVSAAGRDALTRAA
jgi:O-methyltransferase domain/Dimerisation domain